MKNILGNILPISGLFFILAGIAGLANKLFDTNIGIYETEIPSDPVVITILMFIGVACLIAAIVVGKRSAARANS